MIGDQPQAWPVREHQVLANGRVTDFVVDELVTPSGEVLQRQYLTHPGAVAVVAWDTKADKIACLRQYRHPVKMEMLEIPAGLLDVEAEQWSVAASRELAEEVELAAADWRVLVDCCTSPGSSQESLRIFLARDPYPCPRPAGFKLEGEELHMSWDWVDREELLTAIFTGRCQSPALVTGIMALETARSTGRLEELRAADVDWPIRHQK